MLQQADAGTPNWLTASIFDASLSKQNPDRCPAYWMLPAANFYHYAA